MLLNKLCALICKYMRKYKFTVHNTGEGETRRKWEKMEHMYPIPVISVPFDFWIAHWFIHWAADF